MTDEERQAWDERYAEGTYTPRSEPTPFLAEWLGRIPVGRALDIATGTGRHALFLAEHGFEVDAVDISEVALERCREEAERQDLADRIHTHVADLDSGDLPGSGYDLIVVVRFRNRALWPRLREALAPNGWIVVEHHMQTDLDVGGPTTDAFRLAPGELLEAFRDLRIVHYSETLEVADMGRHGQFLIGRLIACAGNPGW